MSERINDIAGWMRSNRLQLNPEKAELLWCSTGRRQHRLPTAALLICSTTVAPVFPPSVTRAPSSTRTWWCGPTSVRRCHVTLLCCIASTTQHPPSPLGDQLPVTGHCTGSLLTGLRYGNRTLVGAPAYLIRQLVQNAAARLIFRLRCADHITDALLSLHWLRVPERIVFKMVVHTYQALFGDGLQYLRKFTPKTSILHSDDLLVPAVRLITVGCRIFPVAGACIWNDLP